MTRSLPMTAPRSYLYVPGDQPRMLMGAHRRGADAVIVDLEDAVRHPAKAEARAAARGLLLQQDDVVDGLPQWWVRVNASTLDDDIAAVVTPGLCGVVVPKATAGLVHDADASLTAAERATGRAPGACGIIAVVESAAGLYDLRELAGHPRVSRLGIGEADLAGELGLQPGADRAELWPLRLQLVVASVAAGIQPPIGPVEVDLAAPTLAETTRTLLRQGFRARTTIHPDQVGVVNAVFTPTADELAQARAVVDLLQRSGEAVAVTEDRGFVDPAVARSAREVLSRERPPTP